MTLRYYSKFNILTFKFALILIFPIIWALLATPFNYTRDTQRALFYLLTPPLVFFLGVSCSRIFNLESIKKYLIYYGSLTAIIYLILLVSFHGFSYTFSPTASRLVFFFPKPAFCLIAFILLLDSKFSYQKIFAIIVNLYGIFICGSRTYMILFFVFIFLKFFKFKLKNVIILITTLIVTTAVLDSTNPRFAQGLTELSYNFEEDTKEDIGIKYRGFETYMAYQKIISGELFNIFFGFGLNENVDLGYVVNPESFDDSMVPILHNGFLYTFLRTGILGFIFYVCFFIFYFRRVVFHLIKTDKALLIGCIISLQVTNFVISGFYNLETALFWFVLGVFCLNNRKSLLVST